jgi:hypothetical protein
MIMFSTRSPKRLSATHRRDQDNQDRLGYGRIGLSLLNYANRFETAIV